MKDIKQYILESKIPNEVVIKDIKTHKHVDVVYYCYDKDSLVDTIEKSESVGKYWINKGFFIATKKNNSSWVVDTDKECVINSYQPNSDYIKCDGKKYTFKEIVELLEKGDTMVIVINKED